MVEGEDWQFGLLERTLRLKWVLSAAGRPRAYIVRRAFLFTRKPR